MAATHACQGWVKTYGPLFQRLVTFCGKNIASFRGARLGRFGANIHYCARAAAAAAKEENVQGVEMVAACVRSGHGYGAFKRGRR